MKTTPKLILGFVGAAVVGAGVALGVLAATGQFDEPAPPPSPTPVATPTPKVVTVEGTRQARLTERDRQRKKDLDQYRTALVLYEEDFGKFPPAEASSRNIMRNNNTPFVYLKNYLTTFFPDPLPDRSYYYASDEQHFAICADLEGRPGTRYQVGPSIGEETAGSAQDCKPID